MSVNTSLRAKILERNSQLSEEDLNAAMERAKTRVSVYNGALPPDYEAVADSVRLARNINALVPSVLPTLWRDKKTTQFYITFAELTGIDYHQTVQLFDAKDLDGIAMVSRAAGFDRALYVTIAVLLLGETGMSQAKVLGELYNEVPVEAAQRALRFMKVRAANVAKAA
jgi:uncharacterized protein (DUF2336 family)